MAAPLGNQNAKKAKVWEGAIRRALADNDGAKLRSLADSLIAKAEEGDVAALKEIGDRLDGKPAQAITGSDGGDLIVRVMHADAEA